MNFREVSHQNVIIHLDIDYFYAQVEEVLNPELKEKPFGIQQGVNIVTCNYIARSFGIKKWRPLKECLEKCPDLVLVDGSDLSNYKIYSKKIAELLHTELGPSERMGLDEHFLDITKLVNDEISKMAPNEFENLRFSGPFYPDEVAFSECKCGCEQRLMVGSQIAQKIRAKIFQDLKLTCSVGIAHNKLLAKLVGTLNKPNNQTVLAPMSAAAYMRELKTLKSITGIGGRTASRIEELGITTIEDLQKCDPETLRKNFGGETAARLKEMSMGIDLSEVKPSGKPKTVGLEDSCKPFTVRSEAEKMYRALLARLVIQIQDDGRIPQSIKVTVRKYDPMKKSSIRETKQFSLLPSNFRCIEGKVQLSDGADEKILKNVMNAFDQMVGKEKYFINLIGLCFCKFQEQFKGSSSIAGFLMKKEMNEGKSKETFKKGEDSEVKNEEDLGSEAKESLKFESELEPSPKRRKIEEATPNHLSPTTSNLQTPTTSNCQAPTAPYQLATELPLNIDPTVWRELPSDVQQELLRSWQAPAKPPAPKPSIKPAVNVEKKIGKQGKIDKHFLRS